jgi:hypothetical protein
MYPSGYIQVSESRDLPLLRQVLHSAFVTHCQLFQFMQLASFESCREAFNWRLKRLVAHGLLIRHQLPDYGRNFVYSLGPAGAIHLTNHGDSCSAVITGSSVRRDSTRVAHAIEINDVQLLLLRHGVLREWTSELEIRSRNEMTGYGYAKDYDAVVTLAVDGVQVEVALEYERRPKTARQYTDIRAAIDKEKRVERFLYLVPDYNLLWFIHRFLKNSSRAIFFGIAGEFKKSLLQAQVVDSQMRFSKLGEALL